jgi:hypothetical protein
MVIQFRLDERLAVEKLCNPDILQTKEGVRHLDVLVAFNPCINLCRVSFLAPPLEMVKIFAKQPSIYQVKKTLYA